MFRFVYGLILLLISVSVNASELNGLLYRPKDIRLTETGLLNVYNPKLQFDLSKGEVQYLEKDGFEASAGLKKDDKYNLKVNRAGDMISDFIESQPNAGVADYEVKKMYFDSKGQLTLNVECFGDSNFALCKGFDPNICEKIVDSVDKSGYVKKSKLKSNKGLSVEDLIYEDVKKLSDCSTLWEKLGPLMESLKPNFRSLSKKSEIIFYDSIKPFLEKNWNFKAIDKSKKNKNNKSFYSLPDVENEIYTSKDFDKKERMARDFVEYYQQCKKLKSYFPAKEISEPDKKNKTTRSVN